VDFTLFDAERIAELCLSNLGREFPNQIQHTLASEADLPARPRDLTPAFFGCYDWHSAVHSHWTLVRFFERFPDSPLTPEVWLALARSLSTDRLETERAYLAPRPTFERPYGLAWLVLLALDLARLAASSRAAIAAPSPDVESVVALAMVAGGRLREWFSKLTHPVRAGTHAQSAFAMGLLLDAASPWNPAEAIRIEAMRLHGDDRDYPIHLEPSGEDFLSPSLGAADLMRRVLAPTDFRRWLDRVLPTLDTPDARRWLTPVEPSDRTDGRLAHLDGLALSRAFMMRGVASALPADDVRRAALLGSADAHTRLGIDGLRAGHYAGGHWLGTFAMYLFTNRGHDATMAPSP
jgi:hypothetical protein